LFKKKKMKGGGGVSSPHNTFFKIPLRYTCWLNVSALCSNYHQAKYNKYTEDLTQHATELDSSHERIALTKLLHSNSITLINNNYKY